MTFDEWWDSSKSTATPDTYKGWEESCRQAWEAATLAEREACADLVFSLAPSDESACEMSAAIRMRSNSALIGVKAVQVESTGIHGEMK